MIAGLLGRRGFSGGGGCKKGSGGGVSMWRWRLQRRLSGGAFRGIDLRKRGEFECSEIPVHERWICAVGQVRIVPLDLSPPARRHPVCC